MKKTIFLILSIFLISSCGITMDTVVDNSYTKLPHKNILMVIPYKKNATMNFVYLLKEKMNEQFKSEETKLEFLLFEQTPSELKLDDSNDTEANINYRVSKDNKDLVIIFHPINYSYSQGDLVTIIYEISGIDPKVGKNIWKAKFTWNGVFGPSRYAEKCAKIIYDKLKLDKII